MNKGLLSESLSTRSTKRTAIQKGKHEIKFEERPLRGQRDRVECIPVPAHVVHVVVKTLIERRLIVLSEARLVERDNRLALRELGHEPGAADEHDCRQREQEEDSHVVSAAAHARPWY